MEVSNIEENPFDILIADHLMHFSPETLSNLLRRVGFMPTLVATDWVPKEISLLAGRKENGEEKICRESILETHMADKIFIRMSDYVDWLRATASSSQ